MSKIISLMIIMSSVMMMVYLIFRNVRCRCLTSKKSVMVLLLMALNMILGLIGLIWNVRFCSCTSAALWLSLLSLYVLSSVHWMPPAAIKISCIIAAAQILLLIVIVLDMSGIFINNVSELYPSIHLLEGFISAIMFTALQWNCIKDIKSLMDKASAWHRLEAAVDSVYAVILALYPMAAIYVHSFFPDCKMLSLLVFTLELGMMAALCLRITEDIKLVIMSRHETVVVESLKISQMEMGVMVQSDMYKELYERILTYFETEKPYLNCKLTINDVARVVYSNKLYISRAISQSTGRNFCQFVNFHRITYAVELFRDNPELKVAALSQRSGFNSPVTFNVAFHLFMNDNPSDWLRKERAKIHNKKK